MQKLAAVLTLLTLSSAMACPVKAGKISNGLMNIPSGLKAECGPFYEIYATSIKSSSEDSLKWIELYQSDYSIAQQTAALLGNTYKKQGYSVFMQQNNNNTKEIAYINKQIGKFVIVQLINVKGQKYLEGVRMPILKSV